MALFLLTLPAVVHAQFYFRTNNGAITIEEYTGSGGIVVIPSATNGYPVSGIDGEAFTSTPATSVTIPDSITNIDGAFFQCTSLTNVIIPNSVASIGGQTFGGCTGLTGIAIPNSVTSIGTQAFDGCTGLEGVNIPSGVTSIGFFVFSGCTSLTNITIPNSVTNVGYQSFYSCSSLANVTIPNSVTVIGFEAFYVIIGSSVGAILSGFVNCTNLASVYFQGNATPFANAFSGDANATVYYLPGTTGWSSFIGAPTQLWYQPQPEILNFESSFGVHNHQFSFPISWATNGSVTVQACTNLSNPTWIPLTTNSLSSGTNYFTDPAWTNIPCRFYRVTGP